MTLEDPFRLRGKIAVVTGGSRGIGRSIALGLARAGADVVVSSRDVGRCVEVASEAASSGGVRGVAIRCDVSVEDDVVGLFDRVAAELGGTDVFVHCAGVATAAAAIEASRRDLEDMLAIHFLGAMTGAQKAASQMRVRNGGAILLVTSIWGLGGHPMSLAYGSAKAALANAVRTLAIEWARDRIRVNGLAPGFVETEMTAPIMQAPDLKERLLRNVPMRRVAQPDEMAGPAVFLCSDAASYVTGHILVADGGARAR